MNWKQNKIIFNYIINQKYIIKKDIDTNNIFYIKSSKFKMKCKYFLAFIINEKNNIFWSTDNPYIDQKTKYLSYQIKINVNNNIFSEDLLKDLKKIFETNFSITYEDEKIYFCWFITGNYKKYKKIYIITEIIYFNIL